MFTTARLALLLGFCLSVGACAPMLTALGTNATVVQSVAVIERVKLAGDVTSYASSQKTLTDHAVSLVTGKDCRVFNVVTKDAVCADGRPAAQTEVANARQPAQVAVRTADYHPPATIESNLIPAVRIDSLMAMPAGTARAVAANAPAAAQDEFVAVAGTNLRRRQDASNAAPDSEIRPEPRAVTPPAQHAIDLSRDSASGD